MNDIKNTIFKKIIRILPELILIALIIANNTLFTLDITDNSVSANILILNVYPYQAMMIFIAFKTIKTKWRNKIN